MIRELKVFVILSVSHTHVDKNILRIQAYDGLWTLIEYFVQQISNIITEPIPLRSVNFHVT